MIGLLIALFFLQSRPLAALQAPSIEQQAEIEWYLDRAKHAVNDKKDSSKKFYNPSYGMAREIRAKLEFDMGLRDNEGNRVPGKSLVPSESDLKKISGGWKVWQDKREEYAKVLKICQDAEKVEAYNNNKALKLTEEYYGLNLKQEYRSGKVINGPPWNRNQPLVWAPRYSNRDPERDRVGGAGRDGFIREDGATVIRKSAFEYPGALAAALYHEMWHQADLLTPEHELDLRNEPSQEVIHRWLALSQMEKVLELNSHDWGQELKNLIWQDDLSKKWDALMTPPAILPGGAEVRKDPYNQYERIEFFDKQRITKEREAEIGRQVDHDLKVFEDAFANGRGDVEAYEYIKANAQEDFFKQRGDKIVLGLARGWKEARALEAGRREREILILVAKAGLEARQCGFEPIIQGARFIRFRINEGGWGFDYNFTGDRDLEEVKAGFLLARACVSITRDRSVDLPCNDALDAIGRRGTDPEFWNDTDLKTRENQENCMQHLRDNIKPPFDARAFDTASKGALAAHLRRTKQEEEADARRREIERHNREIEERERRRRDRDESGEGGGGRGHGDPFLPPWVRDPWNGGR